jgi:hypothetical protein
MSALLIPFLWPKISKTHQKARFSSTIKKLSYEKIIFCSISRNSTKEQNDLSQKMIQEKNDQFLRLMFISNFRHFLNFLITQFFGWAFWSVFGILDTHQWIVWCRIYISCHSWLSWTSCVDELIVYKYTI